MNKNSCYIEAFINIPGNISLVVLTVLNLNKFVVLQFFNYRKQQIFKSHEGRYEMRWYIKLFKILNAPYFYLIYFVVAYAFICLIQAIALSIVNFKCGAAQTTSTISLVLILIILVYGVVLFILDILLNFERVKKYEFGRILRSDPFNFRVEVYVLALSCAGPIYITANIVNLIGSLDNIFEMTLSSLTHLILYFYLVAFPLGMTILKLIFIRKSNLDKMGELESLLNTDDGFELISKACEMEYSIENLACWKDIQDYKKDKSIDDKKKRFSKIKKLYLNGSNSEMEINVGAEILDKIFENVKLEKYDNELLKELEYNVTKNLKDTFFRLSEREEYKLFLKHRELMVQTNIVE